MLVKDMYRNTSWSNLGRFGLTEDQMRSCEGQLIQNAGWYNRSGEFLGYGDLVGRDLNRIAAELEADEMFVILFEGDWRLGRHARDHMELGNKLIQELATCVVFDKKIYRAIQPHSSNMEERVEERRESTFRGYVHTTTHWVTRERIAQLIAPPVDKTNWDKQDAHDEIQDELNGFA